MKSGGERVLGVWRTSHAVPAGPASAIPPLHPPPARAILPLECWSIFVLVCSLWRLTVFRSLVVLVLLVLSTASPTFAVDTLHVTTPDPILEEWRWTTFERNRNQDGAIRDVFEDRDGNIWLATDLGVQRYDGHRWTTYTTEDGLADSNIRTVTQTRDGTMWFGSRDAGITCLRGNEWSTYTTEDGLAANGVSLSSMLQARDGKFWVGFSVQGDSLGTKSGISRYDGQSWTTIGVPVGPPRPAIRDIHQAADGSLWFTTNRQGVLRFDGTGWTRYTTDNGLAGNNTISILESRDGSIWAACFQDGVSRFSGGRWQTYTDRDDLPERTGIVSLWQTADGTIWAGGGRGTLCRFEKSRWRAYTSEEVPQLAGSLAKLISRDGALWLFGHGQIDLFRVDLASARYTVYTGAPSAPFVGRYHSSNDQVFAIGDAIWLGGPDGAARFDGHQWRHYTAVDGLIDGAVSTILGDRAGGLWVAGQHQGASGAARFDGAQWRVYTEDDGLVGINVYGGYVAANGDIWFGTKLGHLYEPHSSAGVMRFDPSAGPEHAAWTVYTTQDGLIQNMVYDIAQTPDGAIWVGTRGGLNRFDGTHWESFTPGGDQERQRCHAFCVARDGSLWMGHFEDIDGATRYDGEAWTRYTEADGLLGTSVTDICEHSDGTLWFATLEGVSRFDGTSWQTYDIDDFPVTFGQHIETLCEAPDGALWVRGETGAVVRWMPERGFPPKTSLDPAVDQVSSAGNILLKWSGSDRWNDTPPEQLRYQWRMDSGAWSPSSGRQDFTFTELTPGIHRFEVRAVDRDSRVDPEPAAHAFVVESPWWRNPWVMGLGLLLVAFAAAQTVRLVRRDRVLRDSNVALSDANRAVFDANQELQREGAVARLRAQVQAMGQASDFDRVLSLLSEDLSAVGLSFDTCGIDVLEEPVDAPTMAYFEQHGFPHTAYTIDPEGAVSSESYRLSAPFPPLIRGQIERLTTGDPWQGRDMDAGAIVEVPISGYGRLRLTALDRQEFTEEDIEALRDFAAAIALGYARYLDIREIQEQTERKSAFLASMSHEPRTPMNAIKGFTNVVLRRGAERLSDRHRDNLSKVIQASDHLLAMINDLLDLSKIEAGRMDVNPEPFDVRSLVAACCATVSPLVSEKANVELNYDIPDDVGEANTDQARVRQMVINLLSNAVKFTDAGSVTVSASRDGDQLVIAVSDTGKGIPADEIDTIFDEYRQVKGSDREQKGTGLGLSITKKFAELLGGSIGVESEEGKGSVFTVRMPMEYAE